MYSAISEYSVEVGAPLRLALMDFEKLRETIPPIVAMLVPSVGGAKVTMATLPSVSSLQYLKAVKCIIQCYDVLIGAKMGASAHEAVQNIFERWLNEDPNFNRVSEFYQGSSKSAHGFFMLIISPELVKWLEGYWNVLRGSVDLARSLAPRRRISLVVIDVRVKPSSCHLCDRTTERWR
jgi:hypothetical protein